jgi:signal transduction histidine kinase
VGPHKVLCTGEPELVPDVTELWLEIAYEGPEGRKLALELAPRSVLLVPLRSRGRTLGLVTFAMAASGRRFGPADVTLGQELGRRLALAIDNARLYRTAQQAIRARDDVLGIVAHDLRSPLNAITTSASLLLRQPTQDEQLRRHLGLIRRSSQQMERLIQDLLDVTRIEAGNLVLEQRSEDVAALVKEASDMFDDAAREKQLRLECHVEEDVPAVYADRFRVLQVLSNLLGNALKFTPAGGMVTLRAARDGGPDVRFSVSDSGPGIPEEQRAHIFDRFWQARETAHTGVGLGLSIARAVVEAHGGRIWVDSRPGEGSTFSFTLPAASHEQMH